MSDVWNFDTGSSSDDSKKMADYLKSLPTSTILIGVTAYEASRRIEENGKNALLDIGVDVTGLQHQGKLAFVAHVGHRESSLMRMGPRYGDNLKIKTTRRMQDCAVNALSWGNRDNTINNGYITVKGKTTETKTTNERGFNLVEIDVSNCSISDVRNFNTSGSQKASEEMAKYINSLPKSTVLIGVTAYEARSKLDLRVKKALLDIGVDVSGLEEFGKVAFLAHVGRRDLTVMQMAPQREDNVKILTTTKLQGCVITASSWGREDTTPNNGYITVVNGETNETQTTNGNGFNLVELDVIKCSLSEIRNFDTGTTTGDSEKMAIFLESLQKSTVLIGVTSDEASEQLETSAKNALLAIGVDLNGLRRHGKVAFVAHVGRRELTVMQMGHESDDNVQLVTSTRRQDCGVTAVSWGYDDTTIDNGYVNAGGETRTINERGFNLVELDVSKCSLSGVRNFDTHGSTEASQAMADYLKDLPASTVLIGVTADEASYRLDTVAKAALVAIGVDVTGLQHQGKVAFVAHKCRPELSVMQMGPRYDSNVKISTTMEVSVGLRDCSDIRARGYTTRGVYTVYICNQAMEVYCEITANSSVGWTVFQKRKDGSVDFYRGWEQYRTGFGDLEGEFWLGNDNLHTLTSAKRYKLRIELTYFDGKTAFAEYDNFKVASLNDKYKLTSLGTYSGTAGNAMFHNSGHNFSTKDDDSTEMKCAAKHKAAWWYYCNRLTPANDDSKSMSNLNGLYYETPTGSEDGVKWYHWKQSKMQIKQSVMKITPFV